MEGVPELWTKSPTFPCPLHFKLFHSSRISLLQLPHPSHCDTLQSTPLHLQTANGNFNIKIFDFTLLKHYVLFFLPYCTIMLRFVSMKNSRQSSYYMKRVTTLLFVRIIKQKYIYLTALLPSEILLHPIIHPIVLSHLSGLKPGLRQKEK